MFSTRYLDPKNDLSFKKVFGDEKHKGITIDFLNAALNLTDDHEIIDLEFLDPHQSAKINSRKETILDVLVRDQGGTKYIVEMQVIKVEGFEKRSQLYAAKAYCTNFEKGESYHKLKKVVFLAIMNFVAFPDDDDYKSNHIILNAKTYKQHLKDFSFTFVELPKFNKTIDELHTIEDKWYYFFKHATENHKISEVLCQHHEIKEAYEVLDRYHWSEEEIQYYEKLARDDADKLGMVEAAEKDGIKKGKEEGKVERNMEIAKNLLNKNFSNDQISEITGLSNEEIENMRI